MASSENYNNFNRVFDITWSRGRSKAQTSFGKILNTISAASAAPDSPPGGEVLVANGVGKKRSLWEIDLNVAPPEDDRFESPSAKIGHEIRPVAAAAIEVEKKLTSADELDLNFNGIAEKGCSPVINGSKGEINGFVNVVTVSEEEEEEEGEEREEKGMRESRWDALLGVAENVLRDYEEEERPRNGEKTQNRKRKTSQELELGGEKLLTVTTGKRISGQRRRISATDRSDVTAAEEEPVVVRSTRGRALAMPNKYRDSVLESAEAEFRRRDKSGKSAAVVPTKRKSR